MPQDGRDAERHRARRGRRRDGARRRCGLARRRGGRGGRDRRRGVRTAVDPARCRRACRAPSTRTSQSKGRRRRDGERRGVRTPEGARARAAEWQLRQECQRSPRRVPVQRRLRDSVWRGVHEPRHGSRQLRRVRARVRAVGPLRQLDVRSERHACRPRPSRLRRDRARRRPERPLLGGPGPRARSNRLSATCGAQVLASNEANPSPRRRGRFEPVLDVAVDGIHRDHSQAVAARRVGRQPNDRDGSPRWLPGPRRIR